MKQIMMMKVAAELLKNSHRSDRELAKVLRTSQPTVTRIRNKLEKEGFIQEYSIIPHFVKLGFEILVITLTKTRFNPKLRERAVKSMMANPNVVMCARSEGFGKNGVIVSLHRSYSEYSDFITKFMEEWGDTVEDYDSILISLGGIVIKPFSLKPLAELIQKQQHSQQSQITEEN